MPAEALEFMIIFLFKIELVVNKDEKVFLDNKLIAKDILAPFFFLLYLEIYLRINFKNFKLYNPKKKRVSLLFMHIYNKYMCINIYI